MSHHDDLFKAYAVPELMEEFADAQAIDITSRTGSAKLADGIDAILGAIESYDEIQPNGTEDRRDGRRIDVIKSDSTAIGLATTILDSYVTVLADSSEWDVERVESETATMIRLTCLRREHRQHTSSGFYTN